MATCLRCGQTTLRYTVVPGVGDLCFENGCSPRAPQHHAKRTFPFTAEFAGDKPGEKHTFDNIYQLRKFEASRGLVSWAYNTNGGEKVESHPGPQRFPSPMEMRRHG